MPPMQRDWLRQRLAALGRTQAELARHLGLDASAVTRLVRGGRQLKGSEAAAIARFLGCPVEEVLAAFGAPAAADGFVPRPLPLPAPAELPRDLPIYGAAIGGADGAIELNGEAQALVERPPQLSGVRNAYAVYVTGESMHPMFQPGWVVHVNPNRPITPGCGVVVQLRPAEAGPPLCYIKEFRRRTPSQIVLFQYNPAEEIVWPLERVLAVHRVVGVAEM